MHSEYDCTRQGIQVNVWVEELIYHVYKSNLNVALLVSSIRKLESITFH